MPAPVLQFKRGQWTDLPGLRAGEPGFTTDTNDLYIGINSTTVNNKFFGSHRYWGREDGIESLKFKLVDKDGSNAIHLKSPNTVSGIGTYTLPDPNSIINGYFLKVDNSGNLSWVNSFNNSQVINGVFSGISTFLGLIEANFGIDVVGHSEFDNINVSGIATISNTNITQGNFNTVDVVGVSTFTSIIASQIDANNINVSGIVTSLQGNFTNIDVSGIATISNTNITQGNFNTIDVVGVSTFQSPVYFYESVTGTISTATRAVFVDVESNDSNSDLFYPVFVDTSSGQNSETLYVNNTIAINPSTGDLSIDGNIKVSGNSILDSNNNSTLTFNGTGDVTVLGDLRINGGDIHASDGQTNISMNSNVLTEIKGELQVSGNVIKSSTSGAVLSLSGSNGRFFNDLTVDGNFYVKGTTTEIDTISLKVEDRTIDLGMIDGSSPSFPTTWDLGILFNYYTTSAKKSALIWEHSNSRFQFANEISEVGGSGLNDPQVTVSTFAPIEISSLWVTDCVGTSKVVDCVAGERVLENIVLDAGLY